MYYLYRLYKLFWLAGSRETTGTMYFTGHGNFGSVLGISTYPVIWFKQGKDTIFFNGNVNIPLKQDETVSVRYQINNPSDAKVNSFACIWGDTVAYEPGALSDFPDYISSSGPGPEEVEDQSALEDRDQIFKNPIEEFIMSL